VFSAWSVPSPYKELWRLFKGIRDSSVSRKTSFNAVRKLKTLFYLESTIIFLCVVVTAIFKL
jgi:hypothetical protein